MALDRMSESSHSEETARLRICCVEHIERNKLNYFRTATSRCTVCGMELRLRGGRVVSMEQFRPGPTLREIRANDLEDALTRLFWK